MGERGKAGKMRGIGEERGREWGSSRIKDKEGERESWKNERDREERGRESGAEAEAI